MVLLGILLYSIGLRCGYERGHDDGVVTAIYMQRILNIASDRQTKMGFVVNESMKDLPIKNEYSFQDSKWYELPVIDQRKNCEKIERSYNEMVKNFK